MTDRRRRLGTLRSGPAGAARAADRRRRGAALPRRGEHRGARDLPRGRGRRALDAAAGRRRRGRDRRRHAGGDGRADARRRAAGDRRSARPGGVRRRRRAARGARPARPRATPCCGSARARSSIFDIAPIPNGARPFYFLLASIGIFTLLVGGAVRLRRPRDPATLHFFWLSVAFFGVFTFSFSGRLDRLDWVFYWGDAISILLLPPLFLHFALVFPERRRRWTAGGAGRAGRPADLRAGAAARRRARRSRWRAAATNAPLFVGVIGDARSARVPLPRGCFIAGLVALTRALAEVRSITARRQLRWIAWGTALGVAPFALGYALPWAMGVEPSLPMQLSAIPLEPDSARLRLGDRPLPADGRRGDRQARARLRGGARRHRRHLRGAAAGRSSGSSPRGDAGQQLGARRWRSRWSRCCWRRR